MQWGTIVADEAQAFEELTDALEEAEIIEFCREGMAAYRVPRTIEFRDELPKSILGKVLRRELAAG